MEKLVLPKPYLSYSQMRLWLDDKEKYRDRYYRRVEEPGSKYLLFGSEVAKGLEDGTMVVPGLIQYPVSEFQIKIEVDGVPFFAYIDSYDPARFKFREYKTGMPKRGGLPRWTQKDVNNHMQLDVYSLLIQIAEGQVDDECHLDWLVTQNKYKRIEFGGHVLEGGSDGIELAGDVVSFRRVIEQKERDRMRALIRSVADEISRDWVAYSSVGAETPPSVPVSSPA